MKTKLVLALAIIMGLITTYLFYDYMKQFDVEVVTQENMVNVIVAKEAIKKNQKISSEMVKRVQIPAAGVHAQAVSDVSEIVGLYATSTIEAGEAILTHRVQHEKEEMLFVSRKVQEGFRAVSVGVNFVRSVSNLIEPEDYVDVIFTKVIKRPGQEQVEVKTELLLQNTRVLAVGRRMVDADSDEPYVDYSSVTLELNTSDSITLIKASEEGDIQLILHTRLIQPSVNE